ncbi:hypothetical protein PTKIN_Ptkin08bG0119200 [Pterospermum kingtungense]
MNVEEIVAMFLHIISHHTKNRVIKRQLARSSKTVIKQFNVVLKVVLRLHTMVFKKKVQIAENCSYSRWRWFKGCLEALDGSHIKLYVPSFDRARYRSRKEEISTNVLGVCTPYKQFAYVLPGWEGSATNGRDMVGKYYVVFEGRKSGIYNTWEEARDQILGYPSANHKLFKDKTEAEDRFAEYWGATDIEDEEYVRKSKRMTFFVSMKVMYPFIGVLTTLVILYIGK